MTDRPLRSEAIDISPVDDGYVVYDPDRDMVHYLNHTAAITLELCDGQHSEADVAAFLSRTSPGSDEVLDGVRTCLAQLRDLGLVEPAPVSVPAQAAPLTDQASGSASWQAAAGRG